MAEEIRVSILILAARFPATGTTIEKANVSQVRANDVVDLHVTSQMDKAVGIQTYDPSAAEPRQGVPSPSPGLPCEAPVYVPSVPRDTK